MILVLDINFQYVNFQQSTTNLSILSNIEALGNKHFSGQFHSHFHLNTLIIGKITKIIDPNHI